MCHNEHDKEIRKKQSKDHFPIQRTKRERRCEGEREREGREEGPIGMIFTQVK